MKDLLLGVEALKFLERERLPVLKAVEAAGADEAASAAAGIGFPVALKLLSPDVIHKTEESGVKVGLGSEEEVRRTFQALVDGFALRSPEKRLDGLMVQKMGTGLELIVGSIIDEQFGPVLMLGLGGIFAEAMKDVTFRLIPIAPRDAREMIEDLKGSKVLTNPRGEAIDLALIERFLLEVSRLIEKHGEVQEMDLNPVFVSSRGIEVCDARLKIARP